MTIIMTSSPAPIVISVHCAAVKSGNLLCASCGESKTVFRVGVEYPTPPMRPMLLDVGTTGTSKLARYGSGAAGAGIGSGGGCRIGMDASRRTPQRGQIRINEIGRAACREGVDGIVVVETMGSRDKK